MTTKPNGRFSKLEDKAKAETTPEQIRERTLARAKADAAAHAKKHEQALAEHKISLDASRAEHDQRLKTIQEEAAAAAKEREIAREKMLAEHVALASRASKQIAERQP